MFLYALSGLVTLALVIIIIRGRTVRPTHAGGIVIKQEGEQRLFLLVTASGKKDKWVLPKGRIEKNETPEFAAIREVMEESGVSAKPLRKAGIVTYRRKRGRVCVVYFLMLFDTFYDTSTEDRILAWVGKEDAIKMLHTNNARRILNSI